MGFLDKIKDLVNVPDDDELEEQDDEIQDYDYEQPAQPRKQHEKPPRRQKQEKTGFDNTGYSDFADNYIGGGRSAAADRQDKSNKVVNIHTTTQVQVVLVKPERLEEVTEIADHLNAKRTVVLNLESTQRDVARRIVDFLQGVAYANGGGMRRVAASTFIIIPHNVNIVGDLIDELENNGVFF